MLNLPELKWKDAGNAQLLADDHQLNTPGLLFEKIEDATIERQVQKLFDTKKQNDGAAPQATPAKPDIDYDTFARLDIRTGTILQAEKVAKTKKLVKLKIDTGIDQRTVVSGIAEYFEPETLIGRKVSILVNLAPRTLRGIESQGMILMAENHDGTLGFVAPPDDFANGSEIK